jgi:hypothetical protein
VIEVRVRDYDLLYLQAVAGNDGEDFGDIRTGVDHHGFMGQFVTDDGAIALKGADGKNLVNHRVMIDAGRKGFKIWGAEIWGGGVLQRIVSLCGRATAPAILGFEDYKETTLAKRIAIVLALLMVSAAGFAQVPTAGNVFLGYTLNRASSGYSNTGNLNGWELSAEGKVAPFAGVVAELSTQYGGLQLLPVHQFGGSGTGNATTRVDSLMFGPRFSVAVGKIRPFAEALVGVAHLHEDALEYAYGESGAADELGGGFDYRVMPALSWRVQADLLQTRFHQGLQNDVKVATGVVVNF